MYFFFFFFFNDTATTEIYTLSLHDALPICSARTRPPACRGWAAARPRTRRADRKSTRLNSSHVEISYAVFCLKKKKKNIQPGHATQTNLFYSMITTPPLHRSRFDYRSSTDP